MKCVYISYDQLDSTNSITRVFKVIVSEFLHFYTD